MRFHTIKQGEEAVVFNIQGEGRHIVGPERVFLFRERLEKLRHVRASQYQYLVVKDKREGIVTHRIGPCEMFHNPLDHDSISVEDAVKIDANHLIVVYRRVKDSVERSIVQGPAIFFPGADEWLHKFEWHGADPGKKERMVPGIRKFTQLAAIPDQFYYNVRDVRTTDDIIITVKLMIFFQINDVNVMLDTTHDPVADMINAVCADVIAYVGRLKYEEFLEQTESLSELCTYPQLQQRTQRVGFHIHKVVYRGYEATEQLQRMQTEAIEARTRLRLDAEIEDQKQKLVDYKLQTEQDRTKMRQQMERSKQEHRQTVDRLIQEHQSEIREAEHVHQMAMDQVHTAAKLDMLAADQAQREGTLSSLREMGVDLTQYLVSQQPAAVSQELQLITRAQAVTQGTALRV